MEGEFSKLSLNTDLVPSPGAASSTTPTYLDPGNHNTTTGAGYRSNSNTPNANSGITRTPSTSSQYNNFNANLHARVKAFQEQRASKRSSSIKSNSSDSNSNAGTPADGVPSPVLTTTHSNSSTNSNSNNSNNPTTTTATATNNNTNTTNSSSIPSSATNISKIVNKPLPPLPNEHRVISPSVTANTTESVISESKASIRATNTTINATSTTSKTIEMSTKIQDKPFDNKSTRRLDIKGMPSRQRNLPLLIPSRITPRRPPPTKPSVAPPLGGSTPIATGPTANAPLPSITPKPSLSARRGLKLGNMSLKISNKSSSGNSSQEFESTPANKNHLALNNGAGGKRSNPGSLVNGIQSASTSSSNDEQKDTEGTEPKTNSTSGSNSGGLFANFSKYVDIKSGSLNFAGKLSLSSQGISFSNGYTSKITLDELEFIEELGHGNYGNVSKVLHKPTNVIMAMKEVRLELDEAKFRQILMELEVLHKCQSPYIVDFYGAFFIEGAVYMCMEYMDGGSLDKIYDDTEQIGGIDEPQLAYITNSVIEGLKELKDVHNIIHRDVKPTNILCSAKQGTVKLCDFGVSGNLVASLAKTNIGCQSYMAPERIRSMNPDKATYTVQSDIWSLGLSILEMALGRYPYPPETFDNIFSQLSAIVDGPPPKLPADRFSDEAQDFVSVCLQKIPERRPTYARLLEHPWLKKYRNKDVSMSRYITERLEKRRKILEQTGARELPKFVPALHMGGL